MSDVVAQTTPPVGRIYTIGGRGLMVASCRYRQAHSGGRENVSLLRPHRDGLMWLHWGRLAGRCVTV